jgi:hypothetical protein
MSWRGDFISTVTPAPNAIQKATAKAMITRLPPVTTQGAVSIERLGSFVKQKDRGRPGAGGVGEASGFPRPTRWQSPEP